MTSFLGMINWRTSVAAFIGVLINLSGWIPALAPYHDVLTQIGLAVGLGGVGMMAKDGVVTGGSVPQTAEASQRALSAPIKAPL